jgi:uncharacterized protein YgiB involved in biofilm formation
MDNLVILCILGLVVVVGLFLLPRLLRSLGGTNYSQQGNNRPEYDDPNINSRGSFGGPAGGERPTYDSPNVQSRGMFGRSRGSSSSGSTTQRHDSPNIQSRGSFGKSKK